MQIAPGVPDSGLRAKYEPAKQSFFNSKNKQLRTMAQKDDASGDIYNIVRNEKADLLSHNGDKTVCGCVPVLIRHTALHLAVLHNKIENVRCLIELLREQNLLTKCLEMTGGTAYLTCFKETNYIQLAQQRDMNDNFIFHQSTQVTSRSRTGGKCATRR